MHFYTSSMPMLIASGAPKYENGKLRALYPTDIISYCMASYVLDACEALIVHRNEIGLSVDCEEKFEQMFTIS